MPKCAFLTIKDLSDFECYDDKLISPMNQNGWECEFIPWDQSNIDWNNFDLAIIRSTWDYQDRIQEFLDVLENINSSNCILENSLELVKWNIDKSQTVAMGDGANDLVMMAESGLGVACHGKPVVNKQADVAIRFGGLHAMLYFLK